MKVSDKRKLPKRPVDLTLMGLGCAQMGNLYRLTPYEEAKGAFDAAWQGGIRYFDTAPYYGHTRSERRLGTMLTDHERADYKVSTKAGRVMVPDASVGPEENGFVAPLPFRPVFDYSYDGILRSFEASQQRLGIVDPDVLYVHDIGSAQHDEQHDYYWAQLTAGGGFRALDSMRDQGLVSAVGLGVNEWQVIQDAMQVFDVDVAMLAGRYTLLEQESLPFMDGCAKAGTAIVIAGAFNSGILAGNRKFNYDDATPEIMARVEALEKACLDFDVKIQAAALQFPLAHTAAVSVVSGARNASQITSNIAWFEEVIPAEFWLELRARGLVCEAAPFPSSEA